MEHLRLRNFATREATDFCSGCGLHIVHETKNYIYLNLQVHNDQGQTLAADVEIPKDRFRDINVGR